MKKILLACFSILSTTVATAQQLPPIPINVPVKAWIIMDYDTGEVLADYNGNERLEPASVTKVMTSYLIADAIEQGRIKEDSQVTISPYAQSQEGSRMFAEAGSKITVHDLVLGLVIQSGNDSSIALAEYLHGSEPMFALEMNKKAAELGMRNSNFMNASGLPHANHYSTAYDIALLSRRLIQDFPEHYKIYSQKSFSWNNITQKNRNTLLWTDPTVDGIKTGHTSSAGYNLASSAIRNDFRVIVVVLGTNGEKERAQLSTELINYAFLNFEHKKLYNEGQVIMTAAVHEGETNDVNLVPANNVYITFPRGQYDELTSVIEVQKPLLAPIEQGAEIGKLIVKNGNKVILKTPLHAETTIEEASFIKRYWDKFKYKFQYKFQKIKAQIF